MRQIKELYGLVITSKIRLGIIKTLAKKSPMLQSEIARKMKKKQQDISKEMYKLVKEGLVECLTPDKGSYKAYVITKVGKEVFGFKL